MSTLNRTISLLLAVGAGTSMMAATTCVGAELYSKSTVKYGRWEVRMKAAAAPGSVSSFFTYNNNSYLGDPNPWREIDIEVLGNNANGFQSNIITGAAGAQTTSEVKHVVKDLANGFHTYVLDWTPDSVVWRVDGVTMRKDDAASQQVTDLQDSTETWRMNLWASSSTAWVGKLDLTKLPLYQVVNWMRYSSYAPGAGDNGTNFKFSWLDDFTKFDTKRWSKGDWTFDGNLAQLSPLNLNTVNGYLVLSLTRPGEEGVTGTIPTDPQGDTYSSTGVLDKAVSSRSIKVLPTSTGIRIEGMDPAVRSQVAVTDARGRNLATYPNVTESVADLPLSATGVLLVKVGDRSQAIVR